MNITNIIFTVSSHLILALLGYSTGIYFHNVITSEYLPPTNDIIEVLGISLLVIMFLISLIVKINDIDRRINNVDNDRS